MASVIKPLFDCTATRAAISFPRAEVEINNALGECEARTDATASAMAGIPCWENATFSTIITFSISYAFSSSAIAAPVPGSAKTKAVTPPIRLPNADNSPAVFAIFPEA